MPLAVLLTDDAARDLEKIHDYVAQNDAPEKADQLLDHMGKAFAGLSELPERGSFPKKLLGWGVREYRQVYYKPCRIIYRVGVGAVFVLLIAEWQISAVRNRLSRR